MTAQKKTVFIAMIATLGASGLFVIRECQFKDELVKLDRGSSKVRERPEVSSHAEVRQGGVQALLDSYKHAIALYGKVVDQFGEPVPDATIEIFVHSGYYSEKSGTDAVLKTDKEGGFSITGLTGGELGASAMKDGYLRIPALSSFSSSASLSYTGGEGTGDRHANPSNPLVLELLKIGPVEPMIHVGKKRWKLPLDGTPQIIALDTEKGQGVHQIQFRLLSETHIRELSGNNAYTAFDWSFEIRIPGGGFVWDGSDAKFEAPQSGYRETIRYEYSAAMPREKWKRLRYGRYFVRFSDGTYGRIQFEIDGGSDRKSLYMESWLSLKPGSRNLATDNMIIEKMEIEEPEDDPTNE